MSVDEVIPTEYDNGKGAGLRTESLRKAALKGQTETAAHKGHWDGAARKGRGKQEARRRECFKRQVIA